MDQMEIKVIVKKLIRIRFKKMMMMNKMIIAKKTSMNFHKILVIMEKWQQKLAIKMVINK